MTHLLEESGALVVDLGVLPLERGEGDVEVALDLLGELVGVLVLGGVRVRVPLPLAAVGIVGLVAVLVLEALENLLLAEAVVVLRVAFVDLEG